MTYEAQGAAGAAGVARDQLNFSSIRQFLTLREHERVLQSLLVFDASLVHGRHVHLRHSPLHLPCVPPQRERAPSSPWYAPREYGVNHSNQETRPNF